MGVVVRFSLFSKASIVSFPDVITLLVFLLVLFDLLPNFGLVSPLLAVRLLPRLDVFTLNVLPSIGEAALSALPTVFLELV